MIFTGFRRRLCRCAARPDKLSRFDSAGEENAAGSACRPACRKSQFIKNNAKKVFARLFQKAAGEKRPRVPEGTRGLFEGGALSPGPQALLQALFPLPFFKKKGEIISDEGKDK